MWSWLRGCGLRMIWCRSVSIRSYTRYTSLRCVHVARARLQRSRSHRCGAISALLVACDAGPPAERSGKAAPGRSRSGALGAARHGARARGGGAACGGSLERREAAGRRDDVPKADHVFVVQVGQQPHLPGLGRFVESTNWCVPGWPCDVFCNQQLCAPGPWLRAPPRAGLRRGVLLSRIPGQRAPALRRRGLCSTDRPGGGGRAFAPHLSVRFASTGLSKTPDIFFMAMRSLVSRLRAELEGAVVCGGVTWRVVVFGGGGVWGNVCVGLGARFGEGCGVRLGAAAGAPAARAPSAPCSGALGLLARSPNGTRPPAAARAPLRLAP